MSINASKKSNKISADVTNPSNWNFGTKCLQAGWKPKVGEPRVLPIFQSTTYKYEDVEKSVYESLLTSTSKGRFMNENIKGQYNYSRV